MKMGEKFKSCSFNYSEKMSVSSYPIYMGSIRISDIDFEKNPTKAPKH